MVHVEKSSNMPKKMAKKWRKIYRVTKMFTSLINVSQSSFEWRGSSGSLRQLVTTNWAGFCGLGVHRIIWSCQSRTSFSCNRSWLSCWKTTDWWCQGKAVRLKKKIGETFARKKFGKKFFFRKFYYGKVGVIFWLFFHLIWKNYVLYWDLD